MRIWLRSNKIEIFVLTILSIIVGAVNYLQLKGFYISFFDPDDYMRLVRMHEFFSGGNFYDQVILRANSPFGGMMHWSRFYDILWIVPVRCVLFFTSSVREAVEFVGFIISPILSVISALVLLKTLQFVLSKQNSFIVTALFVAHPFIIAQFVFGRPDYHAFIILMIILHTYWIVKLISGGFSNNINLIWLALVSALCVWASPETLIPLLVSDIVLFFASLYNQKIVMCLYFKDLITACIIGTLIYLSGDIINYPLALTTALLLLPYTSFNFCYKTSYIMRNWHAFALVIVSLIIPTIAPAEYDRLSSVHMALYIYMAIFFSANLFYLDYKPLRKLKYGILWGLIIGTVFLMIYPNFINGMEGSLSNYVKKIWLYRVEEMKSPFASNHNFGYLAFVLVSMAAIGYKTKEVIRKLSTENIIWLLFVSTATSYLFLSCLAYRMVPYAVLFTCPIIVDFIMNGRVFSKLHSYLRILLTVVCTLVVQFIPMGTPESLVEKHTAYSETELYQLIDSLSERPVTILAHINSGTKLLWLTKHKIVAAPYHRHVHGIIAEYEILQNKFDWKVVRKFLKNTNTNFVIIDKKKYKGNCPHSFGYFISKYSDNLNDKNVPREIFQYAKIKSIPEKFDDIIVVEIDQTKL